MADAPALPDTAPSAGTAGTPAAIAPAPTTPPTNVVRATADQIDAARGAGYSDHEIASYLAGSYAAPARAAGYNDGDIINYLTVAPPKAAPPPTDTGFIGAIESGIAANVRGPVQTAYALAGGKPREYVPTTVAEQPVELNDLLHPGRLAEKAAYNFAANLPVMGAFAAGSAIAGGPEEPAGLAAGAVAAGAASAVMALGPRFAHELKANPGNPDAAFDTALKSAAAEGAISTVAFAAFGWAPFKGTVKNILFQAFGVQPAVSMGGQAAQDIAAGKAAGTVAGNALAAYPGAAVGTLVPMAGFAAGRAALRLVPPAAGVPGASSAPDIGGSATLEGAAPVMAAPDVDTAIAAATRAAQATPFDLDAEGQAAEARAAEAPAIAPATADRFGGLNAGTIEQTPSGGYVFRGSGPDGAQADLPLVSWNEHAPNPGGEPTIAPDFAAAQRRHYDALGVHVVYFQDDPAIPFDGAIDPAHPNTIFLSNDPTRNAAQVGAHEFTHVLESTTLPDGSNLGDVLHQQVRDGLTQEGVAYGKARFGPTAPERATFPAGPEGDAAHADAVVTHIVREMGADIGGEAPAFPDFAPRVIDAVDARFGPQVAKGVLGRFIDGIRAALGTIRQFAAGESDPAAVTLSQNWVRNLGAIHDTLAQMYAERYGTQIEKEQAAVAAMNARPIPSTGEFLPEIPGRPGDEFQAFRDMRALHEASHALPPLSRSFAAMAEAARTAPENATGDHPGGAPEPPAAAEAAAPEEPLEASGRIRGIRARRMPSGLLDFLAWQGGVQDPTGELRAMDLQKPGTGFRPGFGWVRSPKGLPPDYAREAAIEHGFLPEGSTVADLYDAIDTAIKAPGSLAARGEAARPFDPDRERYDIFQRAAELGIEPRADSPTEEVLAEIAEREAIGAEGNPGAVADRIEGQADALTHGAFDENDLPWWDDARSRSPTGSPETDGPGRAGTPTGPLPGEETPGAGLGADHGRGNPAQGEGDAGREAPGVAFSPREEPPLLPTPAESPKHLAARQRIRDREIAEARMRGRKSAAKPQEEAAELPLFGGKRQGALFSPKRPGEPAAALPEENLYRDEVSDLIGAALGEKGEHETFPFRNGRGGSFGPSITERNQALDRIAKAGVQRFKNVNVLEGFGPVGSLFPRTLATLDTLSAKFYSAVVAQDEAARTSEAGLRRVISKSLAKLSRDQRKLVYGAIELARKWNFRVPDDGRLIHVKNTSYWQARMTKVGQDYTLTPAETRAFHDLQRLGDEGWRTFMRAVAQKEGWEGDLDPVAILNAAEVKGAKTPQGKQLGRLAATIASAQRALERPYFPAMRFGRYFIAVTPKAGADVESLGGYPRVEWFETTGESNIRAALEPLGVRRPAAQDVPEVKAAIDRIRAMKKPNGSLAFPEADYAIETGDLKSRPDILRKLDIPAIEKLFMLMERGVVKSQTDKILAAGVPEGEEAIPSETGKRAARAEAKARYAALLGETKDALMDAIYQDMLAGWKKPARLVPGYDADFDRAIGTHMHQVARNAAAIVHREDIDRAYQDIQDNHPYDSVKAYWKHFRDYMDGGPQPGAAAAASLARYGATWMMAMNPATTLAIALHTPLMATPVLSVGGNAGQAIAQMARAVREVWPHLKFDAVHGAHIPLEAIGRTPRERAMLAALDDAGLTHSLGADDVRSINEHQSGWFGEAAPEVRRAMDIATSNVSATDRANRLAIALATFRMAMTPATFDKMAASWLAHNEMFRAAARQAEMDYFLRAAQLGEEPKIAPKISDIMSPEQFTHFMMSEAAGAWGKLNQAPAMRGAEGSLLFAMHGFQTRYLSTAWKLMRNMGPEGRTAGAFMMAGLAFGVGALGLPFAQDLTGAADSLWKQLRGEDPMIEAHLRRFLVDGFGKVGADVAMYGPLSVGLGVDLTDRLGFGDIISGLGANDLMGTVPEMLYGRLTAAWNRYNAGQGGAAIAAEALPSALRNVAEAYLQSETGKLSQYGRRIAPAAPLSPSDIARTALGFQTLGQEKYFAALDYWKRLGTQSNVARARIVATWATLNAAASRAEAQGDKTFAAELRQDAGAALGAYERAHPLAPITDESLRDAALQMENPEIYGLTKVPRARFGEAARNPYQ